MSESLAARQRRAIWYYDRLAVLYDFISNWYYRAARQVAVRELQLASGRTVLNVPCGTGVNFGYFEQYLAGTGLVLGIDLSGGMLGQAARKVAARRWHNVQLYQADAVAIDSAWLRAQVPAAASLDAVLCDLGLSGLPEWQRIIDNLLASLRPGGRFVILDWYQPRPRWRAAVIRWLGKGEVSRPLYHYLQGRVDDFRLYDSLGHQGLFVASGSKPAGEGRARP